VVHLKPRMVVLHGPKDVDQVGKALAEKERIILAISGMKEEQMIEKLSALSSRRGPATPFSSPGLERKLA
jgi:predicted transcriptional regulator